jgi:agmatinase
MTKKEKIEGFDPNGFAENNNLFGLPFTEDESEVVVLPVPWEVTVSYKPGTAKAPTAIKKASLQVDLYDPFVPNAWRHGAFMRELSEEMQAKNERLRKLAEEYLQDLFDGNEKQDDLEQLNEGCAEMVDWVKKETRKLIQKGKKTVLLGGDHSTSLGYIHALSEAHPSFGILQIDAHADLREAYEGFTYSHASIMYNALKKENVERLVQVGIRDYCQEESERIQQSQGRIVTFYDKELKHQQYEGTHWVAQCEKIISKLPQKVYISFDIDGLDPKLCPNTGTPVAGGLEVEETLFLLEMLVKSGREIIGIDLVEVSPGNDEWDANVGARLLYKLSNLLHYKHGEE